jgi:cell division protein FtsQ
MLKMERGAARAAGRNANVEDLDEWRQARGSRASSERRYGAEAPDYGWSGQEWDPEWDQDKPAFWEQEDPWGRKRERRQARAEDEEPELDAWMQAWRDATQPPEREYPRRPAAGARRPRGETRRQPREEEWPSSREFRWQPREEEEPYEREFIRQPQREEERPRGREYARPGREERQTRQESNQRLWQEDRQRFRADARVQSARRGESQRGGRRVGRDERWAEEPAPRADARREKEQKYERSGHPNGLLLLMALLGLLAIGAIIGLKVFQIRSVTVKGNNTVSAESIIALSGIGAGENILKANLVQAKKNIESDPLLHVLNISRVFPDIVSIEVCERAPHGAIAYLGGYVIIDENGIVLDYRDSLPAGQYPLVTGVEIKPSEKGKPVSGVDGVQQKTMYDLLSALYDSGAMQYVSEADLGNGGNIWLLTGEGLQIELGKPTDLYKKAQWVASSVPELRKQGYTSGVLHITGTESPVYSEGDSGRGSVAGSGTAAQDGSAQNTEDGGGTVGAQDGNAV